MTSNPFLRLHEAPVETLTDAAFVLVLLAAMMTTWWAGGRNVLWLYTRFQSNWKYLPPWEYAVRSVVMLLVIALDLALLAAIIGVLS
jgi:hypothetical protein